MVQNRIGRKYKDLGFFIGFMLKITLVILKKAEIIEELRRLDMAKTLAKASAFITLFLAVSVYFQGCKSKQEITHVAERSPVEHKEFRGQPVFGNSSKVRHSWADSVFHSLGLEEKIAQLFMVAAYSNKDAAHVESIRHLVQDLKIGGLIFMQGGPVREANLTNYYQGLTKTPLLISIDGEWGLSMRLDSTTKFPRQQMLGAIQNDLLIFEMGEEIARQCKLMGIHIDFAPVLDVNSNPDNPVIGNRSFGEDKINVTLKGLAYLRGLQDNQVLACGKHFPGHGDTDVDSHFDMPALKHSTSRLDTLELFPFKEMFDNGLGSVMVGHLFVPALDSTKNMPATLSHKVVNDLLREKMKYQGLIFTDALNMQGVAKYYTPAEINLKALLAGNDILLFSEDVENSIQRIKQAIESGEFSIVELDKRVKRILKVKEWAGLAKFKRINPQTIHKALNEPEAELINRRLVRSAITLLQNENNLLPLKSLDTLKIAAVCIGDSIQTPFLDMLGNYTEIRNFYISHKSTKADRDSLVAQLKDYNLVIAGFQNTLQAVSKSFGITAADQKIADTIAGLKPTILVVFANAYSLKNIPNPDRFKCIIETYEQSELAQQYAAMGIFGGIGFMGNLPVTSGRFKMGMGTCTRPIRIRYGMPEEVGLVSTVLSQVDSLAKEAIFNQATPGCQIWAMKDSVVFLNKAFGYYTYENKQKVNTQSLYDLASITKAAATLPMVMKVYDAGLLAVKSRLGQYLPRLVNTNKDSLKLLDIMTHRAGLKAFIPFGSKVLQNAEWNPQLISSSPSAGFAIPVATGMFALSSYPDSIRKIIDKTEVDTNHKYVYSDLGMYYMKDVVESLLNKPLAQLVKEQYYNKLGCATLGYNPLGRFPIERIVPTEYDVAFRKQLVQGYVHDPMAALLGGVSGHAGLFGTANDLGKMFSLFAFKGQYAGESYFSSSTLDTFNTCYFCQEGNRRGLILDKPDPDLSKDDPAAASADLSSFGHSGFTGTVAWVDPKTRLVYVFLSNRVYPDVENKKLSQLNIRTRIHELFYKAMK